METQCLGIGMLFMPYSPRWLVEKGREEEALEELSRLRRKPADNHSVRIEFLGIVAEVRFAREAMKEAHPDAGPIRQIINKYLALISSWPKSKRIIVGCLTMMFQQFMVGFQISLSCHLVIFGLPGDKCESRLILLQPMLLISLKAIIYYAPTSKFYKDLD
jgi:hypothetical protein